MRVSRNRVARHRGLGPRRAPRHKTYHRRWNTSFFTNSVRGAQAAQRGRYPWIDNDLHLTFLGSAWGNDHGAPLHLFFRKGDRMEKHEAAEVFARMVTVNGYTYHIRTLYEVFADNHAHGVNTEIEVKDIRPWAIPSVLDARFAEMARDAEMVYGPDWRKHVLVKVLTDLGGGLRYALKICRFAHKYGLPTMLLVRGRARFMRFRGHTEITWVRGSAVRLRG